ncbi:MAG: TonB-dependent receptor [Vicinamibacteria bacterium]|nr:TonB-dependent receptor [Vicinamibacteria bacterium]
MRAHFFRRSAAALAFATLAGTGAAADSAPAPAAVVTEAAATGRLVGRVASADGTAVVGARVSLVDLRRSTTTDADGRYAFAGVPAGTYLLEAESSRAGRDLRRVEIAADTEAIADLTLDVTTHQEFVVVSAQTDPRAAFELAAPVTVLGADQLALRLQPSLGETVALLPGVNSTYFGPGSSRPVIRGLGGDRIRVLDNGLGTGDASSTSPDHAVSSDPQSADQIEVVRGPATLLYGSSAVGGVVNVIDSRIPYAVASKPIGGTFSGQFASAAEDRSGALALKGGQGFFAWHADAFKRKTDDLSIPGEAESQRLRDREAAEGLAHEAAAESLGTLSNSAIDTQGASIGLSLVSERGFFGLAASGLDSLYGVPGHAHEGEHEADDEEAPVRVDLEQRRLDLRAELTEPFGAFRGLRLRAGVADYQHQELEGDEVGTLFENDSFEGRLEMLHKPFGAMSGSFGAQFASRDFAAIGAEAFTPPTETTSWALFAYEVVNRGAVRFDFGARVEGQGVDAAPETGAETRSFTGFSGSAGFGWTRGGWGLGLSLARSEKLPNAEELYSNGPHVATRAWEIGDPDLGKESSLGLDLSLRRDSARWHGKVNLFVNDFADYIYEDFTGAAQDGLDVVQYRQADARFWGAELEAHLEIVHAEPRHLDLELSGDFVRAELTGPSTPLPRIPPARYGVGLHYHDDRASALVELRGVLEQHRVTEQELPTDGHVFLNASLGYRLFAGATVWDLRLAANNLADAEGRNHVSFLKDLAPLPGRDVRLSVRVAF